MVGFEPTIPASTLPQTYALDRAATGIGYIQYCGHKKRRLYGECTLHSLRTSNLTL
jgi:hypothetical protein